MPTAVDTIAPYRRPPQDLIEALFPGQPAPAAASDRPQPCHKQVFASLNGKAWTLRQLQARVQQRDGRHIRARVALTDGAATLQQRMRAALPDFTLVLDRRHVAEHVWRAGTALYGETGPQRAVWVKAQLLDTRSVSSRAASVIRRWREKARTLRQASQAHTVLRQVADYLDRNRPYVDYATYLKRGWPVGTGVIEGVCRQLVKDRMELSGMRWTVAGAEAVLALRAVHENGDWDSFHAFRRARDHEERYGSSLPTAWLDQAERLDIKGI